MSDQPKEGIEPPKQIGICFCDPERFWWDATTDTICPGCPNDDDHPCNHAFYTLVTPPSMSGER